MKATRILTAAIILSTATYTAVAQHGGHGGGHSGHSGGGMGDYQRQMVLQASTEQREMFEQCKKDAGGFGAAVEQMGRSYASGKDLDQARKQLGDTRDQFEAMLRTHKALAASLNHEQDKATKSQMGKLQKLEGSLEANLKVLDTELAATAPNSGRVNKAMKKLGEDLNEWRKQHSKIASELGVSS